MKLDNISKRMGAATLVTALLFTGNSWVGRIQAARPDTTLATVAPAESTLPRETAPPTTEPPSQAFLDCAQIGAETDGRHIFVYDAEAWEPVWCNTDWEETLYPASITKVYAALVGLMYLAPEEVVTAGSELKLMPSDSSRAYLSRGCKITVEMLVEAMLVPSGSDASYVFAAAAGRAIAEDGDLDGEEAVEVFVEEMNRQVGVMGLVNSHFVNPDGYHHDDHYMCPKDVAVVAALAWKEPVIAKYMGLQQDSVTFVSGQTITWYNNNLLIDPTSGFYTASAVGMKTGYTSQAGNCLLAAFQMGEKAVIVGIFGSEQKHSRYESAMKLFKACL